MSHEHTSSVYTRCDRCHTFGINLPDEGFCGNCGSRDTVLYRPPCCFAELERDAKHSKASLEQTWEGLNECRQQRDATQSRLEIENAKLRAEVAKLNEGLDYAVGQLVTEADDLLRARLATAEAAIAAFIASQVADNVWESDGSVEVALAAWRESKA